MNEKDRGMTGQSEKGRKGYERERERERERDRERERERERERDSERERILDVV